MNNLQILGQIDVQQFWPTGSSDADTTKLMVQVAPGSFRIKLAGSSTHEPTNAYEKAFMYGEKNKQGVRKKERLINSKGQITVRLQRVDAPELHINPGPIKGKSLKGTGLFVEYRQRQAETGTVALRKFLQKQAGSDGLLPCVFDSNLPEGTGPGEVVDKYGRFVGDIMIGSGTKRVNLNLWLLEQGWAIVALYDSMLAHEIDESLKAWKSGKGKGSRTHYRSKFEPFELLTFREPVATVQDEGDKKFIHPKYFRRYVTWYAHSKAGNLSGDFPDYLESRAEDVYELDEFLAALKAGKTKPDNIYPLYDRSADGDGVSWKPKQFIFLEAPSTVYSDASGKDAKLTKSDW
jgi:endonuclease YncB( thermonuclease family)